MCFEIVDKNPEIIEGLKIWIEQELKSEWMMCAKKYFTNQPTNRTKESFLIELWNEWCVQENNLDPFLILCFSNLQINLTNESFLMDYQMCEQHDEILMICGRIKNIVIF